MPRESTTRLPLAPGDRVGVVAPGFAVRRATVRSGIARLRALGFSVVEGKSLHARLGFFAGSDRTRAGDLNRMLRDARVRCVWFARGGYGTARILPFVDWDALRRDPKLLIGYSDLTALFAPVSAARMAPCVYGPVVAELGDREAYHAPSLTSALRGERTEVPIPSGGVLRAGRAEGPLLGGNLTVLIHLLGTPYAPKLDGAILALEDAGEEVYRLDRLLTHLRASGSLSRLAGVVLGQFVVPKRKRAFPPDRPVREVLREAFEPLRVPVVSGLPFGHVPGKWSLPLGCAAEIDTRRGRLVLASRGGPLPR